MVSKNDATAVPLPLSTHNYQDQAPSKEIIRVSFFAKSVELYEIINLAILAFYPGQDPPANSDNAVSAGQSEPEQDLRHPHEA